MAMLASASCWDFIRNSFLRPVGSTRQDFFGGLNQRLHQDCAVESAGDQAAMFRPLEQPVSAFLILGLKHIDRGLKRDLQERQSSFEDAELAFDGKIKFPEVHVRAIGRSE